MHSLNKVLYFFGLQLSKVNKNVKLPKEFVANYKHHLSQLRKNSKTFDVFEAMLYDVGVHPKSYIDYECEFATHHINILNPTKILDIGSYRQFILGLLSHYQVMTIDVRDRIPVLKNETVITGDAKKLNLSDNDFDVVISLCALEHFGLGRYGDEFDLGADMKAIKEMIRVLKPDGSLIFTTTITKAKPSIAFNAHRIYSYEMIKTFCNNLTCVDEMFYSHTMGSECSLEEITTKSNDWDLYCGCWKKNKMEL